MFLNALYEIWEFRENLLDSTYPSREYGSIRAKASICDFVEGSYMVDEPDIRAAAKAFSKLGVSKGGHARAEALSPEERREIARHAVMSRWAKKKKPEVADLPRETHTAANVKPFIPDDLMTPLMAPMRYKMLSGGNALGIDAMLVPRICEVLLDAHKNRALRQRQQNLVDTAEILMRGFAHVESSRSLMKQRVTKQSAIEMNFTKFLLLIFLKNYFRGSNAFPMNSTNTCFDSKAGNIAQSQGRDRGEHRK